MLQINICSILNVGRSAEASTRHKQQAVWALINSLFSLTVNGESNALQHFLSCNQIDEQNTTKSILNNDIMTRKLITRLPAELF
mmetsp:Transcript_7942/g.19862  ORF Transcript_7942/g.19862 Transcript_7942/m.19862 type:complete len:84 (+) Transcript_7942:1510-1761(+)